jgi:hypothetical protein
VDNKLNLLPEDQWPLCEKCHSRVPEFANMPDDLRRELETFLESSPTEAMVRLKQAGCTYEISKTWTHHHRKFCREPCTTPCPQCGKTLRTPKAKQCRFCGADWH